jgi:hypothetical protein
MSPGVRRDDDVLDAVAATRIGDLKIFISVASSFEAALRASSG